MDDDAQIYTQPHVSLYFLHSPVQQDCWSRIIEITERALSRKLVALELKEILGIT